MSNVLTTNPIKVDTQMSNFARTDDTSRLTNYLIYKIYWYNPTTIAHLMEIQGRGNQRILIARCEVANQSQNFDFVVPMEVADFKVNDLDSGEVYIYVLPRNAARR